MARTFLLSGFLGLILVGYTPSPAQRTLEPAVVPPDAVIAHRGASHDAPEATEPAYLLARDLGATYLEVDLQRTSDGVLIAFHDDDLSRTTNAADVFPGREKDPVSSFTWAELQQLDAGSWFNVDEARRDRARESFEGLRILTLEQVIDIAEGGDNRPGLYIETKLPDLYPDIEVQLADALERRGWYGADRGTDPDAARGGAPEQAEPVARVIVQTFGRESLELLRRHLPEAPALFLLWLGDDHLPDDSPETYAEWVDFAAALGAAGIGPNHENLLEPWAAEMIHARGLFIHAYTVDDAETFEVFSELGVDGFFTNRPDVLLDYYGRKPERTVDEILAMHGYGR